MPCHGTACHPFPCYTTPFYAISITFDFVFTFTVFYGIDLIFLFVTQSHSWAVSILLSFTNDNNHLWTTTWTNLMILMKPFFFVNGLYILRGSFQWCLHKHTSENRIGPRPNWSHFVHYYVLARPLLVNDVDRNPFSNIARCSLAFFSPFWTVA